MDGHIERLPLFPLNTVLYPDGFLPLRVFEARYVDMTRDCLKNGRPFGICLIREGREVGAPAVHEPVGCLAEIMECDIQQLGVLQLATRGRQRFRALRTEANSQGLITAHIELLDAETDGALPQDCQPCVRLLRMIISDRGPAVFWEPHKMESATWVGCRLAEVLPLPLPAKQKMLEMNDPFERLALLRRFLEQHGLWEVAT